MYFIHFQVHNCRWIEDSQKSQTWPIAKFQSLGLNEYS